jgi:Flp pilus assembly protein TadG
MTTTTARFRLGEPRAAGYPGLRRDQSGAVAIIFAITLTALLGFVALGVEVVFVLLKQREMQAAASGAALASAEALSNGNAAGLAVEAQAIAASDGFENGVSGVTVTVNTPPLSGSNAGSSGAVEVLVSQPQTLALAALFGVATWPVSARAVAKIGSGGGSCVLELDTSANTVVSIDGGATVNLGQCGLTVDGSGSQALQVYGSATLNAQAVSIVGGDSVYGGGSINATNGVKIAQPPAADPYAAVPVPTAAGCKHGAPGAPLNIGYSSQVQTFSADGAYCGGLTIGNSARVVFNPGVYVFTGGQINIGGGSTVSGNGVTLVLTGSGSNYTTVDIANGASITLSAPSTGPTAGLVFFQDRAAPNSGVDIFGGGATVNFTGALYFPNQTVSYGNGVNVSSTCTQLVAWRMTFTGGVTFNNNCSGVGVASIGASSTRLVE